MYKTAPIALAIFLSSLVNVSCVNGQSFTSKSRFTLEKQAVIESSIVLLQNTTRTIPFTDISNLNIATVAIGSKPTEAFDGTLAYYRPVKSFTIPTTNHQESYNTIRDSLSAYNTVIVRLNKYSFSQLTTDFLKALVLKNNKKVVLTVFGKEDLLINLTGELNMPILYVPEDNFTAQSLVAQAIFGGMAVKGKLTENTGKFKIGEGDNTIAIRIKYTIPEDAGVNAKALKKIDDIAEEMMREKAAPGAVVMAIKDGKVIFQKAYGYHTYEKTEPMQITDVFDLASVTKISATTLAVMHLVETGKINLDNTIGDYIPEQILPQSDKRKIKVRDVLLHQAGFIPFIPFYENIKPEDFSPDSSEAYPTKVADHYFMRKGYFRDVMWKRMMNSPLKTPGQYVYSDISMYVMKEVVEQVTGVPLDQYVQNEFYHSLGLQTMTFNPANKLPQDQIVPTEEDTYFRMQVLRGYVHDQGAGMAGGVSGHAGLFSNINDMGILYQMLLNKGTYGGRQYFKPETVELFTRKNSDVSRRGLGFDRWDPEVSKHYPSELASPATFGHTGYTGTCVWVDPAYNLVYIFLSNRVYPKVTDKLSHLRIRGRIQDVLYEAIKQSGESSK